MQLEQRQININREKGESHDNYKKCIKFNDILLDIQTQSGKISQQPTANSQQPTANSQQPTANSQQPTSVLNKDNIQYSNNIFNETERFRIFSDRSFFMPFWQFDRSARCLLK